LARASGDRPVRIISYKDLHAQGFRLRRPPFVLFGLDPSGEGFDRTGFVVIERHELELGEPVDPDYQVEHAFMLRHAERLDREIEFPDVMALMLEYHRKMAKLTPKNIGGHQFVIETNGVGYPFASMLKRMTIDGAGRSHVIPIVTTSASDNRPHDDEGRPRMPRMAGLDLFRVMVQLQRIMATKGAVGAGLLVSEMRSMIYKGARPEAAEGAHDDLVMAGTLAIWAGVRLIPPMARQERLN
jgi:hypothetical protein